MTEDEVIQLLEQADPVRRIEPGPTVDAVGYLDALRTRSTTVTLTHSGPTAKPGPGHRRRWPIIAVAAAVMAVVVGGLALVARDETSDTHSPAAPSATASATTTTATSAEVAAQETARAVIDAENAYDADRMLTYFDAEPENLDELRLQMAWNQAVGSKKLNVHCAPQGESAVVAGNVIFCTYDYHSLRSDEIGFGPYAGYSEFTILRDGKIGPAEQGITESASARFSSEMEETFHWWMSANHPADVAVMYTGSEPRISEESIPLWEQRTREYVASGDVLRPLPDVPNIDDERRLEPGTYYLDEVNGTPTPRIFATLDSGWSAMGRGEDWVIAKGGMPDEGGIGLMTITNPVTVFADACHPSDGFYQGPVDTVDGFVTALREQQGGWVDVTEPSDISVDGYVGKAFQRTTPAVMSDCTTSETGGATFTSWESAYGINGGYGPGQIETVWVLDIDGTVVVISTELWPGPSATADADFADAVLDSIRIERP